MRSESRRVAFLMIFTAFYRGDDIRNDFDAEYARLCSNFGNKAESEQGLKFVNAFAAQSDQETAERAFVRHLVSGVLANAEKFGAKIEAAGSHWALGRINNVEKAILFIGIHELEFPDQDGILLPPEIVIDEAVELAKMYGGDETPKFVNGVLDSIARKVRTMDGTAVVDNGVKES